MKKVRVEDAVGQPLCHDITRIVIGESKGVAFARGRIIRSEDIPELKRLGKEHVYIREPEDGDDIHEEDVARELYAFSCGENLNGGEIKEGKIEAFATCDGLLKVDVKRLYEINAVGELNLVTKRTDIAVKTGDKVAGMRAVPLLLAADKLEAARRIAGNVPIIRVKPFVRKNVGVVTTGTEVYNGLIADAFTPIIRKRIGPYGMRVTAHETVPDDAEKIEFAIRRVIEQGAEVVLCTGGMSVDPDDLTPGAIARAADVVTYGLPVLPGSMVCIAYTKNGTPVAGVPGGVLFGEPSAFEWFVPRFAADDRIVKEECIALGHGGLLG